MAVDKELVLDTYERTRNTMDTARLCGTTRRNVQFILKRFRDCGLFDEHPKEPRYYNDQGCELCASCLNCQFPYCCEDVLKTPYDRRKYFLFDMAVYEGMKIGLSKKLIIKALQSEIKVNESIKRLKLKGLL